MGSGEWARVRQPWPPGPGDVCVLVGPNGAGKSRAAAELPKVRGDNPIASAIQDWAWDWIEKAMSAAFPGTRMSEPPGPGKKVMSIFNALASLARFAPGEVVVWDEFGDGIHPSSIQSLYSSLLEISRRKWLGIVLITYNVSLLRLYTPADFDRVFIKTTATSPPIRLSDIKIPKEMCDLNAGDLFYSGALDPVHSSSHDDSARSAY